MFYSSSSVAPTSYEVELQYYSDTVAKYPTKGTIEVCLSDFNINLHLMGEVEPWCTTKVQPNYLRSVNSFEFILKTLLEKGVDWWYIYQDYLFPMLSRWQHQGYIVVYKD